MKPNTISVYYFTTSIAEYLPPEITEKYGDVREVYLFSPDMKVYAASTQPSAESYLVDVIPGDDVSLETQEEAEDWYEIKQEILASSSPVEYFNWWRVKKEATKDHFVAEYEIDEDAGEDARDAMREAVEDYFANPVF